MSEPIKAMVIDLSHERLLELLHYDPVTGVFTWRVAPHPRIRVGGRAGWEQRENKTCQPHRSITIDGSTYLESRLAWFWMTGTWPANQIDHRNRNSCDNMWSNLRPATASQNCANRSTRRDNMSSGFKGVCPHRRKFKAHITVNGKRKYLGLFETAEEAHAVYFAAATAAHGEYARHG